MSKEWVILIVENDKKRAGLAVFLSGLGIEVEALTSLPEPSAVPGLAIGLSALIAALRGEKDAKENLRRLKKEFSLHLRKSRELEEAYDTTLENFMAALDLRDVETYGHSKTVARYSHVLAEAVGIRDPRAIESIRKGALLHDAGKMAIPDSILKKPGPLSGKEWEVIHRHPALGYGLVRDLKLVREVGNIILCHHEKYDGTGYPKGLKGDAIPLEARVFAVADTLDAVTSHRPYRAPRDFRTARRELVENAGAQFDPKVVDGRLEGGRRSGLTLTGIRETVRAIVLRSQANRPRKPTVAS
jgi:putative nucleotidyltransferase with HDIG domain